MTVKEYLQATGGQAAPVTGVIPGLPTATGLGMTVRDVFAAHAVSGFLASGDDEGYTAGQVAGFAYAVADAMLAERAKVLEGGGG